MTRLAHGRIPARLPRPRLALLAGLTYVLFAPSRSDAGQMPRYEELPVGRVTSPPTASRPGSIPAGESVAGIVVKAGASQALVSTDDATPAKAGVHPPRTGACFSQVAAPIEAPAGSRFSSPFDPSLPGSTQRPPEWDGPVAFEGNVWAPPHGAGVTALHVERLTERDGATVLESTDIWVDPVSRGARLLATATLPLRQVGSVPGGVKLFAGRDERPDGRRYVQFVVARSKDTPLVHLAATSGTRGDSMLPLGTCDHHRLGLLADRTGESATVQLWTALPPLPPGELAVAPPLSSLASPPSGMRTKDVRTRVVRIHMSVSQTSRDKEPVTTLSTGWAGSELNQRTFEPFSPPVPTAAPVPLPVPPPPSKHAAKRSDPGF